MSGLILIVAMFALLWFLMIRPQRAKQGQMQRMIDTVAAGDEVLTVGGLYGIVQELDEEGDLIVEIADGIHVRIARRAVATVVKPEDEADDEEPEVVDGEAVEEDDGEAVVADSEGSVSTPPAGPSPDPGRS